MYLTPNSQIMRRSLVVSNEKATNRKKVAAQDARIKDQLRTLGVSRWALATSEFRYLPQIMHPNEDIKGVVYGMSEDGFAVMVATDMRAVYLDKKPLFVNEDEITYDVISGVSHGHSGFTSKLTLHTRIKDYSFKTLNKTCVDGFVKAIETRCIEHKNGNKNSKNF